MSLARYAQVVLPIPVDKPFTYALPEALRERACVGMRAIVPVKQRIETGYIVHLSMDSEFEKTKELIDLPDEYLSVAFVQPQAQTAAAAGVGHLACFDRLAVHDPGLVADILVVQGNTLDRIVAQGNIAPALEFS